MKWPVEVDWESPAGRLLAKLGEIVTPDRRTPILLFGSAALQVTVAPTVLSEDTDRTELRTRLLEMLCICGGKWRSTRESHSGRRDGAAVFETVSSSMPDVLREIGSQGRPRTYTPCGT